MKKRLPKFSKKLVAYILVIVFILVVAQVVQPDKTDSANFSSASATLGNSRFSYVAGINTGTAASSNITIDTSGNPDKDVDHLFPNDTVCFTNTTLDGCTDDIDYTVVSTEGVDGDQFTISPPLGSTLNSTDLAIATSSGSVAIAFTLVNDVPTDGDILITIPMANSVDGNDGFPDYAATVAASGFDLGGGENDGIQATDIATTVTTSGTCVEANWNTTETITEGSGSSDHTIRIDRQTALCEANATTITVTIDSAPGLVNPAPINAARTQGVADAYTINIKTRDGTSATIDESDVMIAPVEAVLISATIEETLAFTVAGESSGNTRCGFNTGVTTTATSVPWGAITTSGEHKYANQILTLSTNANNGYSVTIQENDQMGKNGVTCTGTAPSSGEWDFSGNTCIRDTVCGATPCTESAGRYWTDEATYPGLGFSLENSGGGTDATFLYDSTSEPCTTTGGGTSTNFCSRQLADIQGGESASSIMTNAGAVDSKVIYVCYGFSIPGTQPAGYYFNKAMYIATPIF